MDIKAIAKEIAAALSRDSVIPDTDGYQEEAERIALEVLQRHA